MGHSAYQLTVLNDGTSRHALHNAPRGFQQRFVRHFQQQISPVCPVFWINFQNFHRILPWRIAADCGQNGSFAGVDVFFGGGGQRFAFPAPLRHAEDALRRVPQKFPDDGIRVRRAFQLPRFPALALFYGENRGVIGIAAFHAQKIPFCVADAVTQRAEPVGIRVIKGDGADSGDALPQIDPKPRPEIALPGGNGHGAAAVPPADDQLGVAVAALKRPADILGAINGGRPSAALL